MHWERFHNLYPAGAHGFPVLVFEVAAVEPALVLRHVLQVDGGGVFRQLPRVLRRIICYLPLHHKQGVLKFNWNLPIISDGWSTYKELEHVNRVPATPWRSSCHSRPPSSRSSGSDGTTAPELTVANKHNRCSGSQRVFLLWMFRYKFEVCRGGYHRRGRHSEEAFQGEGRPNKDRMCTRHVHLHSTNYN